MAATYEDTLPTDKDKIRFFLGDTDVDPDSSALYSDEAIVAVLAQEGTVSKAVVVLAKGLIAKYGQEPVKVTADGVTVDYTSRLSVWRAIVQDMQSQANQGGLSFVSINFGVDTSGDEFSR